MTEMNLSTKPTNMENRYTIAKRWGCVRGIQWEMGLQIIIHRMN